MKKVISILAVCLAAVTVLAGCGTPSGPLSNDYIKINQYDGLEVDAVDQSEVTDDYVDEYINMQLATLTTSKTEVPDRAIEEGDTIVLDCSAADEEGNVLSGTVLTDYELEIGSGSFIPGWEDACIGQPFGEEFTFDLQFPEGYGSDEISGKNATWTVTAKGLVTGEEKAELTDENAKTLAGYDNLEVKDAKAYKKAVKEMLTKQNEQSAHDTLSLKVWEAVMKETEVIKYPDGKVDEQVEKYIKSYTDMADSYGMSYEEFLEQNGMNDEQVRSEMKAAAEENIKRELIAELLADELSIKISKDDYQEKYEEYAKRYGFSDADAFLEEAGEDVAKEMVKEEFVGDWLIEHCKQVEPKDDAEEESQEEPATEEESATEEEPAAEEESAQEETGEKGETKQEDKAAGDSMKD